MGWHTVYSIDALIYWNAYTAASFFYPTIHLIARFDIGPVKHGYRVYEYSSGQLSSTLYVCSYWASHPLKLLHEGQNRTFETTGEEAKLPLAPIG